MNKLKLKQSVEASCLKAGKRNLTQNNLHLVLTGSTSWHVFEKRLPFSQCLFSQLLLVFLRQYSFVETGTTLLVRGIFTICILDGYYYAKVEARISNLPWNKEVSHENVKYLGHFNYNITKTIYSVCPLRVTPRSHPASQNTAPQKYYCRSMYGMHGKIDRKLGSMVNLPHSKNTMWTTFVAHSSLWGCTAWLSSLSTEHSLDRFWLTACPAN